MLGITQHERTHGLFDIFLREEYARDLLRDRQFDVERLREFQRGPRRRHALRHRFAFSQHLLERAPFRQFQPQCAIAAQRAGAGGDQVAQAR